MLDNTLWVNYSQGPGRGGLGAGKGYVGAENTECSLLCLQLSNGTVKKVWVRLRLWEGWRSALQEEALSELQKSCGLLRKSGRR